MSIDVNYFLRHLRGKNQWFKTAKLIPLFCSGCYRTYRDCLGGSCSCRKRTLQMSCLWQHLPIKDKCLQTLQRETHAFWNHIPLPEMQQDLCLGAKNERPSPRCSWHICQRPQTKTPCLVIRPNFGHYF